MSPIFAREPGSFAEKIYKLRDALGMSMRDLAIKSELSYKTIAYLENQIAFRIRPNNIRKLADALNVHPKDLIEGKKERVFAEVDKIPKDWID